MPSYEKNTSSGLWSCRFREPDELGVPHQRRLSGYKTKKEAQFAYEDYIKERDALAKERAAQNALASDPNNMLFEDLLDQYMSFTQKRVKESSFYDIRAKINRRLRPYFQGKKIKEITPKMISDWIENLDYSYTSKKFILSRMASVYKYGQKYFDIKNIMDKVDRPRNLEPKKEMQIWSPEEFGQFIQGVDDRTYEMYFRTLYLFGCRRNEALALTWKDINSTSIQINKSVTTKSAEHSFVITTPKNSKSVRTLPIPPFFSEQLDLYKKEQQELLGNQWSPDLFVFGATRPLALSTITRRFNSAIQKSDVKKIRIHDLRHSCASLLISKGVSIVAVSRQLGHSDVEQTLNTYSHMMPDDQEVIRNTLENLGTNLGTK